MADLLIKNGVNVNGINDDGISVLQRIIPNGKFTMI